jgi:hypothetical protein
VIVRGKLRLMVASGQDSGVLAAERALMDELFGERGRADPIAVLRSSEAPGCRYDFVRGVLHDPRFRSRPFRRLTT